MFYINERREPFPLRDIVIKSWKLAKKMYKKSIEMLIENDWLRECFVHCK